MRDSRFRFWGSVDPRGRTKPPIVAEVPETTVDAGGVAVLRLYDPIDSWGEFWGTSAREFQQALDDVADATEIRLHINSPGGEVYEAVAMTNALARHPARVVAVVDGLAASAASFLACTADRLIMGRNTELMIHDAWGVCMGPAADMHQLGDRLDKLSDMSAGIYAEKAGGSVEDWRAAMLAETWYSADEAVAAGLADEVEAKATPVGGPAEAFDLSIFKHAGRDDAPAPGQAGPDPAEAARALRAARFDERRAARHRDRAERLAASGAR